MDKQYFLSVWANFTDGESLGKFVSKYWITVWRSRPYHSSSRQHITN